MTKRRLVSFDENTLILTDDGLVTATILDPCFAPLDTPIQLCWSRGFSRSWPAKAVWWPKNPPEGSTPTLNRALGMEKIAVGSDIFTDFPQMLTAILREYR